MANELDTAVGNAASILLAGVAVVVRVDKEEPTRIEVGPGKVQAAILMDTGELGQFATSQRGETHNLIMRFYIPFESNRGNVETILRQLMDDVQATFEANASLNSSAGVQVALLQGDYLTAYQDIAGVDCRVLDLPLKVTIRIATTWTG